MTRGPLRVALDQGTGPGADPAAALDRLADRARAAADAGARLLVGPEMSLTGYNLDPDVLARLAEPRDGPLSDAVAAIAADTGVAIVHGFPERADGAVYNAVQLVDSDGERRTYRKTHLFGDLDRGAFSPGADPVVQADLDGIRVGLLVCYDVEFPETVRAHALAGTELLLVPTALMLPFTEVAERIVPVRALENQIHLAYVNRCDAEGDLRYAGLSTLIAPDGSETLRAGPGEEFLVGDVAPDALARARSEQSYLDDRRPALYRTLTA